MAKFVSVLYLYDLETIKYVDYLGAIAIYNDRQIWLTLDGKRLFRYPDMGAPFPGCIQPFPSTAQVLMSPEDPRQFLVSDPESYAALKQ